MKRVLSVLVLLCIMGSNNEVNKRYALPGLSVGEAIAAFQRATPIAAVPDREIPTRK